MTTITQHYGISGPVPFEDVAVDSDNRLFLDPHRIRLAKGPGPFAADAVRCLDSFFGEVTTSIITGTTASRRRGEQLLQRFTEPWETRLGMSAIGFFGHGGSDMVGTWIWEALNGDVQALVEVGVLRRLEHLPLFVNGVGNDITSDIATRIIYAPLARFTASVVASMPEFTAAGRRTATVTQQVWDPVLGLWTHELLTLPIANGRPLLLLPAGWAQPALLMSAVRFYETTVLSYAQLEQAVRDSKGKLLTTPKDRLKRQEGLARGRVTNLAVTLRAIRNEEDLLAAFEAFIAKQLAKAEKRKIV